MKKILVLILVLSGLFFMNSPPLFSNQKVQTEKIVLPVNEDQLFVQSMNLQQIEMPCQEGVVLKYPLMTWTATYIAEQPADKLLVDRVIYINMLFATTNNIQPSIMNPKDDPWKQTIVKGGLTRLDIGESFTLI